MISAGEASGDLHAANLVKALHKIDSSIRITGMGNNKLREAGAELLVDCADIAVVGIVEVLANYRLIKRALNRLADEIRNNPPDLLILVDYQEFNFRLAKIARQHGVKVLFYISPQVWAWRPHRVHKIGKLIDMMAVLFPFEEKFYRKANVPVTFVGHPLVDEARPDKTRAECLAEYRIDETRKVIGLFPGSRKGEISRVLPVLLESAELLQQKHAGIQFILPVASTLSIDYIQPFLSGHTHLDIRVVKDRSYNVMQICHAIMTASGTATLEIALMGIPNAIVYRIAPLSYFILKRMITIDNIGLVNIVAEKNIVREFIQHEAVPETIASEIDRILHDEAYRNNMMYELAKVREKLGKEGGSDNIAQLAYGMLNSGLK
ncbi:MAG: lipid-A-disaccharide synthase [Pseudomonadota bacterium]|nr:lipid-A-disaccharide synthase [Pseudomonadota bacterium]